MQSAFKSISKLTVFATTALFILVLQSPSCRAFEITALYGLNYAAPSETSASGNAQWTGDAASAYGVLISTSFFHFFDLESGFLYENQKSEKQVSGATVYETSTSIQVPILVRLNFDEYIGVGVGYYLGFGQTDLPARNKSDSGLLFDLRVSYPLTPLLALVFDGRYQNGLANLSQTAGDTYNTRSIQVLGGLSVGF